MTEDTPIDPRANDRRGWLIPVGLFLLAVLVRCLYLLQAHASPPSSTPLVDAEAYHRLALQLVRGHTIDASFFWQPVLYPLFLSAIYALTHCSITAAQVIQAGIGGLTCVLTFLLGERLLGRKAGLIAGLMTALYGPLIFFESELQATGMGALWSVLLLLLFLRIEKRPDAKLCLLAGILSAAAILIRPTFGLWLAGCCAWLAIVIRRRLGTSAMTRALAAGLLGFLIASAPVMVARHRSGLSAGTILPESGGINAYIGNNGDICKTLTARPGWEWTYLTAMPYRNGVTRRADCQGFFYREATRFATRHPLQCMSNLAGKTARFLSSREIPRNLNLYVYRQWSSILRISTWKIGRFGFPFGVLLPLAVVGAWRLRRRLPVPVWLFLLLYPLSVILIFVSDRYRVPMVPVLSIVAAGGLLSLIDLARQRERRGLGIAGGVMALAIAISTIPGPFCEERIDYEAELDFILGVAAFDEAQAVTSQGEAQRLLDEARAHYARAIARNGRYADAYSEMGNLDVLQGRPADAIESYQKALRIDPDHGKALHSLGALLFKTGYDREAEICLRRAIELDPSFMRSRFFLGQVLLREGAFEDAIGQLEQVVLHDPDPEYRAQARTILADARAARGRGR